MQWNIRHDEERNYVHAHQSGWYTLDDEASFLNSIFSSTFWERGMPLVVDISAMEMANIDSSVITVASRMITLLSDRLGDSRFALVCDSDRQLEVGEKFKNLVSPHLNGEVKVFRDEKGAIDWATRAVADISPT